MTRAALTLLFLLALPTLSLAAYDFDPDWYETGTVGDGWGDAVTTVGDVNGDGYSDILVGSPQFGGSPFWSKGKVSLYYGSPTGPGSTPDWEYAQNIAFMQLGHAIAPAGDMNADGYADFVVGAPYYSGGHSAEGRLYFFLGSASGPVFHLTAEINEEDANLGISVAYAGDVNGDGYDDVIAGAPGWGGYGSPFYIPVQGRAYVFHGSPTGPSATSDWNRAGGDTDGEFGWDVAGLGDVNGDGYSDVIIGKPSYDPGIVNSDFGAVYVYFGSSTGLSSTPDWSQVGAYAGDEMGRELTFAGDVNGDGYADVLIGVPDYANGVGALYIATGRPSGLSVAGILNSGYSSGWPSSVSSIGDFNGDGQGDFITGGGIDDDAYVYFGAPIPALEERIFGTGEFARTVASAGDVNGDGLGDFLIADPLDQQGAGSVRLYFGCRSWNYSVPEFAERFAPGGSPDEMGYALAEAGDVDGNGVGDLLVGAPAAGGTGEIHLYFGNSLGVSLATDPDWTAAGDGPSGRFGAAVSMAGDVNGDGYADIVATDPDLQQVKVFHGGPGGPGSSADWTHTFIEGNEEFGLAVTGGGDLDGDGFSDIAVGIPGYGFDNGRVRVFFGSGAGIRSDNWQDLDPSGAHYRYGSALTMFGDANGDGFDDLAVGAPRDAGAVYVHYGAGNGFQAFSTTITETDPDAEWGFALAAAGDVNGDGYADFIGGAPGAGTSGEARIYFGSPPTVTLGVTTTPGSQAPGLRFGQDVCGLGDVDGDGRSEVAVSYYEESSGLTFARIYSYTNLLLARSAFEIFYPEHGQEMAGIGDLDGDGSGEIAFGNPFAAGGGSFRIHGPIQDRYLLPPSAHPFVETTTGDPIALRGRVPVAADLRFSLKAWLPIGRTHLNLEWNCDLERQPYGQGGLGTWTPSATHIGGTVLTVDPGAQLTAGERYRWRLRARSTNPYVPVGPWLTFQNNSNTVYGFRAVETVTAAEGLPEPRTDQLAAAIPNPFNPITQLEFRVATTEQVELRIHDVAGRLVRTLFRGRLEPGVHRRTWDGRDDAGSTVASGVYVARLRAGQETSSLKVTLLK